MSKKNSQEEIISLCIVIPVRNVEKMISKVLNDLIETVNSHKVKIILLDNASNDKTKENILEVFQLHKGNKSLSLSYILNEENLGYGGSVKKGLKMAKASRYQWIMIAHGDDQADWVTVTGLILRALRSSKYDLVVTSRFMSGSYIQNYSLQRKLGNFFFRMLTNKLLKTRMTDPGAAILAIKKEKLDLRWISNLRSDYLFHPGLNILFFTSDLLIKEVPINWRDASHPGEIKLINYGINLMKFIIFVYVYRTAHRSNWLESVEHASK